MTHMTYTTIGLASVFAGHAVQRRKSALRGARDARTFPLRQGLWTADLRTPPEQECSNGSLILFAVVLWRTF